MCKKNIHSERNNDDIKNIRPLSNNEKLIKVNHIESHERQTIIAKNMLEYRDKLFKELKVGDQIVLRIQKVERGHLDSQNINDYDKHSVWHLKS